MLPYEGVKQRHDSMAALGESTERTDRGAMEMLLTACLKLTRSIFAFVLEEGRTEGYRNILLLTT